MEIQKTDLEVIVLNTPKAKKAALRRPGLIVLSHTDSFILNFAAEELKRYLAIAADLDLTIIPEHSLPTESANKRDPVFFLGQPARSALLRRLLGNHRTTGLGAEGALIGRPRDGNRIAPLIIAGQTARGVMNGVYQFLEEAVGAKWFPPRVAWNQNLAPLETCLDYHPVLALGSGLREYKPAIATRCCPVYGVEGHEVFIRWCLANRINQVMYGGGAVFPYSQSQADNLKAFTARCHQFGLTVIIMTFPHIIEQKTLLENAGAPPIDITRRPTLAASTRLHCRLLEEFDLDGFDWHPSSEAIRVDWHLPGIAQRRRIEWEALYVQTHAKAMRRIKPDIILAMVSGWNYVNPAWDVKRLFPEGLIAHVVPPTEIIGDHMCDLDSFLQVFKDRCWYWLYADVSVNSCRTMPNLDYLYPYARLAVAHGNGLAPQYTFKSRNALNLMYLAKAAWAGPREPAAFLNDNLPAYYGSQPDAAEAFIRYAALVRPYRHFKENIQISDLTLLTVREAQELIRVYRLLRGAYRREKEGVVRDRLKELAITCLHLLARRTYYGRAEIKRLLVEGRALYAEHYYGEDHDGYYHYFNKHLLGKYDQYPTCPIFQVYNN